MVEFLCDLTDISEEQFIELFPDRDKKLKGMDFTKARHVYYASKGEGYMFGYRPYTFQAQPPTSITYKQLCKFKALINLGISVDQAFLGIHNGQTPTP